MSWLDTLFNLSLSLCLSPREASSLLTVFLFLCHTGSGFLLLFTLLRRAQNSLAQQPWNRHDLFVLIVLFNYKNYSVVVHYISSPPQKKRSD